MSDQRLAVVTALGEGNWVSVAEDGNVVGLIRANERRISQRAASRPRNLATRSPIASPTSSYRFSGKGVLRSALRGCARSDGA
jgi:hypothetical protein